MRYFSAISLVLVVLAALGVGMYFRQTAASDLKDVVEQNSISLTQGYTNTIWRRYKRLFTEILKEEPVSEWAQDKRFIRFSKDSFRYFEGIPVAKLNIYNAKGERFLSTNQSEIILVKDGGGLLDGGQGSRGEAIRQVQDGKVVSRIIPEGGFKAPSGTLTKGSLVQSFIPIMSDSYVPIVTNNAGPKIEAFVEVFYDVTPQWQQLDQFQMVGTAGIVAIFVVLIIALIYTAKKAEKIIARQHEKNLELTSAKARAEAENLEKSQFLANISHELRTPLNAIIGFSDIIKTQALGPVGHQQYIDYAGDINSSGSHLLSLINDILDYSKAEAGKLELEVSEVDATKLVKSCIRLVQTRAEEAKVEMVEQVPAEHFVLSTDAKKLKQILLNLLSNAVKFTPPGGSVTVTAWQNMQDDSYTIEVQDTGIGIAPKDISKAMSPFGQVDSELSRKYEGTGLGLPLTKKFTEVMGGTFQIDSALNEGTTISITLPRQAPESAIKKSANTGNANVESHSEPVPAADMMTPEAGGEADPIADPVSEDVRGFGEGSFEAPAAPVEEPVIEQQLPPPAPDEAVATEPLDNPFMNPPAEMEAPVQTPSHEVTPGTDSTAVTADEQVTVQPEPMDPFAEPTQADSTVPENATPEDLGFPTNVEAPPAETVPAVPLEAAVEHVPPQDATPEDLGFPPAPEEPPAEQALTEESPLAPPSEAELTPPAEAEATPEDLGFPTNVEAPPAETAPAVPPQDATPEDLGFPPAPEEQALPMETDMPFESAMPQTPVEPAQDEPPAIENPFADAEPATEAPKATLEEDAGDAEEGNGGDAAPAGSGRMEVEMGAFAVSEAPVAAEGPTEEPTAETPAETPPAEEMMPQAQTLTPESIADDPALKPLNVPPSNPFADTPAAPASPPEEMENPFADTLPEPTGEGAAADDDDHTSDESGGSPFELDRPDDSTKP
jgi:two-component system cell cycle sensor histidine kinase PleC